MTGIEQIKELQQRVETLGRCISVEDKRADVTKRQERTLAADFWDDPKEAEKFLKDMAGVKFWVTGFDKVLGSVEDLNVLLELEDEDIDAAYASAVEELEALELRNMLGEEGDNLGAVLTAGGSSYERAIKTTCFLADIADFVIVDTGAGISESVLEFLVASGAGEILGIDAAVKADDLSASGAYYLVVVLVFDAVFLAELLELTIAGTDAGQAFFSVVGEDQLEGLFAVFNDPRGVGENFHPVAGREHAGRGELRGAFDFDETHAAGADLVDLFEVAECRDLDGRFMGSLKNCISLGDRHFYSIDF